MADDDAKAQNGSGEEGRDQTGRNPDTQGSEARGEPPRAQRAPSEPPKGDAAEGAEALTHRPAADKPDRPKPAHAGKPGAPHRPGQPAKRKPHKLLMKQPNMQRVLYALAPVLVAGIYFYGWRVLALLLVTQIVGFATEYIMERRQNKPVSMACFVSCSLLALSLPPTTPLWIGGVGAVVAILFAKEVFGGFGRNFANPAITGRAFLYICFPVDLTRGFVPVFKGFPGGFAQWSFPTLDRLPEYAAVPGRTVADAVSQATPMWVSQEFGFDAVRNDGAGADLWDMFLGTIGGLWERPPATPGAEAAQNILAGGSIGEGAAVLILLAGVYLLWTKTANHRLMLGFFLGAILANTLFRNLLGFGGVGEVPPVAWQLLAGTTMYVGVYMVTDPVSAPKKAPAQWAYAVLIGFLMVFLRWRGIFVAAATFSLLLGNMIGPLLDLGAEAWADWKKARAGGKPAPAVAEAGGKGTGE